MADANKLLGYVGWMLTGVGLVFILVGAGVSYSTYHFLQTALRAQGEVFDLAARRNTSSSSSRSTLLYFPVVRFDAANGQKIIFESSTGTSPAAYEVGERVTIVYDPREPGNASIESFFAFWFMPTLFGGLGSLLLAVGSGILWLPRRTRQRRVLLRQTGVKIDASVQRIELNRFVRVNGRHPHFILCQGTDPLTGRDREFRSENLYFDPAPLLTEKTLEVWMDSRSPKRYWVDTEAIKQRHRMKEAVP
jgi:hypothetical protein